MSMAEPTRAAATLPTDKRPDTLLVLSAVLLLALPHLDDLTLDLDWEILTEDQINRSALNLV